VLQQLGQREGHLWYEADVHHACNSVGAVSGISDTAATGPRNACSRPVDGSMYCGCSTFMAPPLLSGSVDLPQDFTYPRLVTSCACPSPEAMEACMAMKPEERPMSLTRPMPRRVDRASTLAAISAL
jgi:hypothetical protein